jgi:hypothetical protein
VIFNCVAAGELSRRAVNFKLRVCEAGSSNSNN